MKPSEEFWAGWVLAYSQWRDNLRFRDLMSVLPINKVVAMHYPYHEASEDKFEALTSALGCPVETLC